MTRPEAVRHVFAGEPPSLLRARWGSIALVTLLVVAGALGAMKVQHRSYKSSASVVVGNQVFADGAEPLPADLGTAKQLATSTVVLQRASRALGVATAALRQGLSVTNPADTDILVFSYTSSDPSLAQQRAEAIAEAFCAYEDAPLAAVTRQVEAVARGARSDSSLSVEQSEIVSPAELPTKPSGHSLVLDGIVALIAGLGLGLGAALLVDRFSDRLRRPADVELRVHKPVLAAIALPARLSVADDPLGVIRREQGLVAAYRSLRVRLSETATGATARDGGGSASGWVRPAEAKQAQESRRVLLVANATARSAPALPVALGLALSMASSGRRVVLLGADLRSGAVARLFGVPSAAGLAEVLRGRASAASALLETSQPGLSVLTEGVWRAQAEDLLDPTRLRGLFSTLCRMGYDVVVDGLPLLESPESRTLLASVDRIVLNVDLARIGRAQLGEVAAILALHDDKFAGTVLSRAGRWRRTRIDVSAPFATHATADNVAPRPAMHVAATRAPQAPASPLSTGATVPRAEPPLVAAAAGESLRQNGEQRRAGDGAVPPAS
jgi:capsular polysaccharide biosynthesis protein/Mrp family chromosome partitioning ATPase